MARPSPDALLAQALDAAHAIDEPDARDAAVAEAAALAARAGVLDMAAEALLDLDDRAARAWIHGELAVQLAATHVAPEARHHLDAAAALLDTRPRWRPRGPGWHSAEDARARLAEAAAELEDDARLQAQLAALPPGRRATADARRAAFSRAAETDTDRAAAWADAVDAARALPDPVDARRALVSLAAIAVQHGDGARVVRLVRATDDAPIGGPVHRAELAEAVAGVLARGDLLPEAATVWGRAADLALAPTLPPDIATALLCTIAESQLAALGPMIAEHTMSRAIARVSQGPLSPDPTLRFPWRRLARAALATPALAGPLRDHLRKQPVVPPGWCYVLGLLELATGSRGRARGAADALEASHRMWAEDVESLWLAAILRCRLGEADAARDDLRALVAVLAPGTIVELPGTERGPQPIERHLVRALLDLGDLGTAVELARTVADGGLRARLLREAGVLLRLEGDREAALGLGREALAAREEALATGRAASALDEELAPLVRLLHDSGDAPAALHLLRSALEAGRATPDALALPILAQLDRQLGAAEPLADTIADAVRRRIDATTEAGERAALLLAWAAASR